jgi:polyphosphate glucokinase
MKSRAKRKKTARGSAELIEDVASRNAVRKVLVVDVGGTSVKTLVTGGEKRRSLPSGPKMTPKKMVAGIKEIVSGWTYDVISIGYPGPVLQGRPVAEPWNLGGGWVGFDFVSAFGVPVKIINDAAMQALGSYDGGKMLFLGLGTGLGTAMVVEGIVEPMELDIYLTRNTPTRTMLAAPRWSATARRSGAVTFSMSSNA